MKPHFCAVLRFWDPQLGEGSRHRIQTLWSLNLSPAVLLGSATLLIREIYSEQPRTPLPVAFPYLCSARNDQGGVESTEVPETKLISAAASLPDIR